MNLSKPLRHTSRLLHLFFLRCRLHLPPQRCLTFSHFLTPTKSSIGPIFVINLDRQPDRWADILRELSCITDASGISLAKRAVRYSAYEARGLPLDFAGDGQIAPNYTLGEQLFVEPQPQAALDEFDLELPISMSRAEIAVARSHIGVWQQIARSGISNALILEDDVWFKRGFGRALDEAWLEMESSDESGFK